MSFDSWDRQRRSSGRIIHFLRGLSHSNIFLGAYWFLLVKLQQREEVVAPVAYMATFSFSRRIGKANITWTGA